EHGLAQYRVRVPVEAGRVLTEEVDVVAAVERGEPGTLRLDQGDRERLAEERCPGIAPRQHLGGLAVVFLAARVGGDIALAGGVQGLGDGLLRGFGRHGGVFLALFSRSRYR